MYRVSSLVCCIHRMDFKRDGEISREEEGVISVLSPPPTMGSMQIAGSNGFAHSIEFMSQAYTNQEGNSEIIIEEEYLSTKQDRLLPIFLKVYDPSRAFKLYAALK